MKYEFTGETKDYFGITLRRIRVVTPFADLKEGCVGGWIAAGDNLSQYGNAWVSGDALVSGDAWVSGDALVAGNALVSGAARVSGDAWVSGDALVAGDA